MDRLLKTMRLHYLQHVEFESPAGIADWARQRGHSLSSTCMYKKEKLPGLSDFDLLIIMGGPMNIYEDTAFPYLKKERSFIQAAIGAGRHVLGICLGAQLIADALGSKVYAGPCKEIGWFALNGITAVARSPVGLQMQQLLPDNQAVLHWHGDTFKTPPDTEPLFATAACQSQGFLFRERVLGLQFHLEMDVDAVQRICQNCTDEVLVGGAYVQDLETILDGARIHSRQTLAILFQMLDVLVGS